MIFWHSVGRSNANTWICSMYQIWECWVKCVEVLNKIGYKWFIFRFHTWKCLTTSNNSCGKLSIVSKVLLIVVVILALCLCTWISMTCWNRFIFCLTNLPMCQSMATFLFYFVFCLFNRLNLISQSSWQLLWKCSHVATVRLK